MPKSQPIQYEIAWIQNNQRIQSHVLIPPSALPTLDGLSDGVRAAQPGMDEVQGFDFLELPSGEEITNDPPGALLETIMSALSIDEDHDDYTKLLPLVQAAQSLDDLIEATPDKTSERGVEFVWDNGGGDDNLFTQHFVSVPNSPEEARFFELLEDFGGLSPFYDFTYFSPRQGREDLATVEDLVEVASKMSDAQPLLDFLLAVRSVDRRDRLTEVAADTTSSPPNRSTQPKM